MPKKAPFFSLLSALVLLPMLCFASTSTKDIQETPKEIMTPNKVQTSIGELNFDNGIPSDATVKKLYDNLDLIRGVEVFLNFIPAVSMEAMRVGMKSLGVSEYNKVMIFDDLMDSTPLFLTGDTDTLYACAMLDLQKDGPMVIEIPKGAGLGTLDDAFFRFVVDMGAFGPDDKEGGTYIILPPEYTGDINITKNGLKDRANDTRTTVMIDSNETKVWVAQSTSYTNWLILRGSLQNKKPDSASAIWRKGLKIYPLKDAHEHKAMEFTNASAKQFNTLYSNDYKFYKELWKLLQKEPLSFIDPELRGQAAAIGIQKGKPFTPDERMQKILNDALKIANATARSLAFKPRDKSAKLFKGREWFTGFVGGSYEWLKDNGNGGRNLDARTLFCYLSTVNTPAMALEISGKGSNNALATLDVKGNTLHGEKYYSLTLPANVPAKDFWSLTLYDSQSRSELQVPNGSAFPSKNSKRDNLVYNDDGSLTLIFGPEYKEKFPKANFTQTTPKKTWFSILRLYGPLQAWFDRSYKPGDFELLDVD